MSRETFGKILKIAGFVGLAVVTFGVGSALLAGIALSEITLTAGVTAFLAGSLLAVNIGSALSKGRPKIDAFTEIAGRLNISQDPEADRTVIIGTTATAGVLRYKNFIEGDPGTLWLVLVLAGYPCDSLDSFRFNGEDVTVNGDGSVNGTFADKLFVYFRTGNETDHAFPALVDGVWDAKARRGRGLCAAAIKVISDEVFDGKVEPLFIIKGADLYDPRLDSARGGSGSHDWDDDTTFAFADNPSLAKLTFLRGFYIQDSGANDVLIAGRGLKDKEERFDFANWIASANTDEEAVNVVGGGSIDRYRADGIITPSRPLADIIAILDASQAGVTVFSGGQYRSYPGTFRAPTLTFGAEDIIGVPSRLDIRKGPEEIINAVRGGFADKDDNYQLRSYPSQKDSASIARIGEQQETLNLPFTTDHRAAQRIALISRRQANAPRAFTATFTHRALRLSPGGETVQIDFPHFDFNNEIMRVVNWALIPAEDKQGMPGLNVEMTLVQDSSGFYTWVEGTDEQSIVAPGQMPGAPTFIPVEAGADKTETVLKAAGQTFDNIINNASFASGAQTADMTTVPWWRTDGVDPFNAWSEIVATSGLTDSANAPAEFAGKASIVANDNRFVHMNNQTVFPVIPGETYRLQCEVNDNGSSANADFKLVFAWLDKAGSVTQVDNIGQSSVAVWTLLTLEIVAPAAAVALSMSWNTADPGPSPVGDWYATAFKSFRVPDFKDEIGGAEKPADNATVGAIAGSGGNLLDEASQPVTDAEFLNDLQEWADVLDGGGTQPDDNATVGADWFENLLNLPIDPFNLWVDPQFELGSDIWFSKNAQHSAVADPLGELRGAVKMLGNGVTNISVLSLPPATEEMIIFFEFLMHKDGSVNAGADGGLSFRWMDKDIVFISTTTRTFDESDMSTTAWTRFAGSVVAPANTALVRIEPRSEASHTAGNFYLSGLSVKNIEQAATDNSAQLAANVLQDQGDGTFRQLMLGGSDLLVEDGDSFTFADNWLNTAIFTFAPGGLVADDGLTEPLYQDILVEDVTASGGDVKAKISEQTGTPTLVTETTAGTGDPDITINKDDAAIDVGNNYTYQIDVTVGKATGPPGEPIATTVVNEYFVDTGAGDTLVGTRLFSNFNQSATRQFLNDRKTINITGMSLDDDWGVSKGTEVGNASTLDSFDLVDYNKATAPSTNPATNATTNKLKLSISGPDAGGIS